MTVLGFYFSHFIANCRAICSSIYLYPGVGHIFLLGCLCRCPWCWCCRLIGCRANFFLNHLFMRTQKVDSFICWTLMPLKQRSSKKRSVSFLRVRCSSALLHVNESWTWSIITSSLLFTQRLLSDVDCPAISTTKFLDLLPVGVWIVCSQQSLRRNSFKLSVVGPHSECQNKSFYSILEVRIVVFLGTC